MIHQGFLAGPSNTEKRPVIFLNEIGMEFEKTGQIAFKEEKFNKALEKDFDAIAEAISGPDGFANRLRKLFDTYTRPSNGSLIIKERGIKSRIQQIDDQIDQKSRTIEQKKQQITDRFSRLEATLGNLQRQQQYLSATLPGAGAGSPISQLLGG
jgi:flagellar hook-associated protein 2